MIFGRDMSARPQREHLLLAAGHAARALAAPFRQDREESEDPLEALRVPARAAGK
jgi:hypothetical protein